MKSTIALLIALMGAGGIWAAATDATPPMRPWDVAPRIMQLADDSMRVAVAWSAAPRATRYVVELGHEGGAWIRTTETTELTAELWVPVDTVEASAFACVIAFNRSPIRGRQEGGRHCVQWTVPADIAAPGDPGGVQVIPDTVAVTDTTIAAMQVHGLREMDGGRTLTALGENEVPMSVTALMSDGSVVACATVPGGGKGWVRAEIVNGWHVYAIPSGEWWPEPDCDPVVTVAGEEADAITYQEPQSHVYELPVWPIDAPVLLTDRMVRLFAHRNTVEPS